MVETHTYTDPQGRNTLNSVVGSAAGLGISVLQQPSLVESSTATDLAMVNPLGSVPVPPKPTVLGAKPPGASMIG